MNNSKRFQVFVFTNGKTNYEYAGSYNTVEEAEEFVAKCRDNRDGLQNEKSPLAEHFKGLEWRIVDVAR